MTDREQTMLNNLLAKKRNEERLLKKIKDDKTIITTLASCPWFVRAYDEARSELGNELTSE